MTNEEQTYKLCLFQAWELREHKRAVPTMMLIMSGTCQLIALVSPRCACHS